MVYKWHYKTPSGFDDITLSSDGAVLTRLWFDHSVDAKRYDLDCEERELPIFRETCKWLDIYFSGGVPDFTPKYKISGITPFRAEVQKTMLKIPYGKTTTYGEIAALIAEKRRATKMSAQAVGGAVGWNPICLIIPCHRVLGANGKLTGYGGGIRNKEALLRLEGIL